MSRVERIEIVAGEDGRERIELFVTGVDGHPTSADGPADFARDLAHHGTVTHGLDAARELRFAPRAGRSGSTAPRLVVR